MCRECETSWLSGLCWIALIVLFWIGVAVILSPSEEEIQAVMKHTGMSYEQARFELTR